ncbi:MAG: hypothetical protein FWG93_06510 [Oscillospiraceae bacterium]|nr:hypothetical protein [Oscillospiraceae bacterium]
MRIEVLYPELSNLFGDAANAGYLRRALPEAEFIQTPLKARPAFADGEVSLIYLGSMTESGQSHAAAALMPYRERMEALIGGGTAFLVTGNALELFGTHIENEDGSRLETLGLFELYARRRMMRRYNSIYLGTFETIEIVGFQSRFSHIYEGSGPPVPALFQTARGAGRRPGQAEEGVRAGNFLGTCVLGPLLPLNPPFTRRLLGLLGAEERPLPYEAAAEAAYQARLAEFRDPATGEEYG